MSQITVFQSNDTATNWMDLCGRVRKQADAILDDGIPTDAHELKAFAVNAQELCDHVERVHDEMTRMIDVLEDSEVTAPNGENFDREIDLAAIEIQRETHELRADPFDILKALLMWRDDPAERLHKRA